MSSSDANIVPRSLSELLAPLSVEVFFSSSWGQTFQFVKGWAGKFTSLMPWSRLNEILRQHRLEPPRIRLVKGSKVLDSHAYLEYQRHRPRQFVGIPRLLSKELTKHLRGGATLILDAADELHEPLTQLAESLELLFHARIQMNLYAGWGSSHGFDIHWDDHDVIILQLAGRKDWKVYSPTRIHPLDKDIDENGPPPAEPLWKNTLEDGDCLYIPRGWWHLAIPLGEPTLHLTIGIRNPTGIALLHWLVDQLRSEEIARKDLPRFLPHEDRATHMNQLISILAARLEPGLLEEYFTSSDAMTMPRSRFSLPWSAMPSLLPDDDNAKIRLTAPRPFEVFKNGETLEFSCNGKKWRFARNAEDIITALQGGKVYSIAELCDCVSAKLEPTVVRSFLGELIAEGLVAMMNGPDDK